MAERFLTYNTEDQEAGLIGVDAQGRIKPGVYLYPNASGNDMTSTIRSALETYGGITLTGGTYIINNLVMPEYTTIRGMGKTTKLITTSSTANGVQMSRGCLIDGVEIVGTYSSRPTNANGISSGIMIQSDGNTVMHNPKIVNCTIRGFGMNGIYIYNTGYSAFSGVSIVNCDIYTCYNGIHFGAKAEYNKVTNVICRDCANGALNNGGNNVFTNCTFSDNTCAMQIQVRDADAFPNNGHGSCVGCSFNHSNSNDGYAIIVAGVTNGFVFSGCQIWYGKVFAEYSNGVLFQGCEFGGGTVTHTINSSCGLVHFSDCLYSAAPSITGTPKISNCYTFAGAEIN